MNTIQMSKKREEKILWSLDELGFLTRSQLQRLHKLGSDRNACRVLKNMNPYLNSFRQDQQIFYLNKRGREIIDSNKVRTKSLQIHHILMRNEAYIYFGNPDFWKLEKGVYVADKFYIRPDVLFKTDQMKFLEIDHLQKMTTNKKKVEKYAELKHTKALQQQYKYFPQLVWLTSTELRKRQLKRLCREASLPSFVVTLNDIK